MYMRALEGLQKVPEGADRREGMAMISGIKQYFSTSSVENPILNVIFTFTL